MSKPAVTPKKRGTTKSRAPTVERAWAPKATGRLPAKINEEAVAGMAFCGASNEEIAEFYAVSTDTIERRFAGVLAKNRAGRKFRLRQAQWIAAMGTRRVPASTTMQIWLGKQELGQKDISRRELTGGNGEPLPTSIPIEFVDAEDDD